MAIVCMLSHRTCHRVHCISNRTVSQHSQSHNRTRSSPSPFWFKRVASQCRRNVVQGARERARQPKLAHPPRARGDVNLCQTEFVELLHALSKMKSNAEKGNRLRFVEHVTRLRNMASRICCYRLRATCRGAPCQLCTRQGCNQHCRLRFNLLSHNGV